MTKPLKIKKTNQSIVDLGGRVASFSKPAYLDFKKYLGLEDGLSENETVTFLNTICEIDERILQLVGCPFRRIYLNTPSTFNLLINKDGSFHDEWGVRYVPRGPFNERVDPPLGDIASIEEMHKYHWPDPNNKNRVSGLNTRISELKKNPDLTPVAGHISAGIFQDCWNMRGMQQFFEDMAVNTSLAVALLEKITEIHIGLWHAFLDIVGDDVKIVETADDLGTQSGMLVSPAMYRKMIKPFHRQLNSAIREKTNAKILFHSCGAIMPIINDLIEIGVDILNPIQPIPGLMDPEELAERYGERLIFHGGLDVQDLLIHGTPEDVKTHVRRYIEVLGPDGYILAPANSIQPGTPPENVLAAYQAAKEFIN